MLTRRLVSAAMDADCVTYARDGDVALIHLDRPERLNAVVPALVDGLLAAFGAASADGVGAVVLAGRGRAFCAGYDLKEPEPRDGLDAARSRVERIQDVTRLMRAFPGAVVAAVHGYALGAGAEFAFGCDLVVATRDAQFGFPEVGVGLSVTGAISRLLPLTVGPARAKELLLLGERFGAETAREWGLVNRVVPVGEHETVALDLARIAAARPRIALALAKSALDAGIDATVEGAMLREVDDALRTLAEDESDAAASAFRAGRDG